MSGLFSSGSETRVEAAPPVPITYEALRQPSFNVGGRQLLNVGPGGVQANNSPSFIQGITRGRGQVGAQRNRLLRTRRNLLGNQNPFIDARVRPLEERLENTLDDQSRGFERRGIFGSLSENELNKTRFLGEREIGDARALATEEALGQILNVEGQLRNATQDDVALTTLRVKDELARLGLSAEVLLGLIKARQRTTEASDGRTTTTSESPSPGSIIGGILSAF